MTSSRNPGFIIGAVLCSAFVLATCANHPSSTEPPADIGRVDISPTSLVLTVGAQQKLTASVFNSAGALVSGASVSWSSDATGVASVAPDGTVSGVAVGTAHISATSSGKQAAITVTVTSGTVPGSGTIVVNSSSRYQTITGWEANAQSGQEEPSFPLYRDKLFDAAVNDLGINRVRLEVRSGAENSVDYYTQWRRKQIDDATWRCVRYSTVNDNSDPNVINSNGFQFSEVDTTVNNVVLPLRQRLAARGEKLFINLTYVAFTSQICSGLLYVHTDPKEYAEFILAVTDHLKTKYGITPDSWEVILEPENTAFWRGKQIGDAIVATAARLSPAGYTPRFVAPSTTRSFNAVPYFDTMIQQVPAAKPYMLELSYHRYSSPTDAELQTIGDRAQTNGINSSMLEHIGSGYEDLHKDLELARVSAWEQFALAFPTSDDGAQYYPIDVSNPANPQIVVGARTKFLRQYFKFIRAGAVRIGATSANSALDPLAFINTNGGYVVVVKASAAASFSVAGLPAALYGIKYTTLAAYDIDLPDVNLTAGQALNTNIPAAGVLTIYHK